MVALGFDTTHFSPAFGGTVPLRAVLRAAADAGFDLIGLDAASVASIMTDHGMRVGLEFVPYSALSTVQMAVDMCDAVGWKRCGLVLDSLHFHRAHTPIAELLALRPPQIALVQFSDAPLADPADLVAESRHGRLVPGDGELPLRHWVECVKAIGYDGVVRAEVLSSSLRVTDPVVAARACRRALQAHWLA